MNGANAMNEDKVRKCIQDLKNGRYNIHYEACSGRPSLIRDELVHSVEPKISEDRRFTIISQSNAFPDVSRPVLYKIVSENLNFSKLCSRWVPNFLTEDHKNKRFECSMTFFNSLLRRR